MEVRCKVRLFCAIFLLVAAATLSIVRSPNALAASSQAGSCEKPLVPKPMGGNLYVPDAQRLGDVAQYLGICRRDVFVPSGGETFCNIFTQAFARDYLGYLPPDLVGLANRIHDSLMLHSVALRNGNDRLQRGWNRLAYFAKSRQAGFDEIIRAASEGLFAVASYKNPNPAHHGHIVVFVPGEYAGALSWDEPTLEIPAASQAGETVFARGPITSSFPSPLKSSFDLFILEP